MKRSDLEKTVTPQAVVEYLGRNISAIKHSQPGHHEMSSVREARYRGRHIVIRTTYHIEVDGVPIEGHIGVSNNGHVHYHGIPNSSFSSAVGLVKELIDIFPDDFS